MDNFKLIELAKEVMKNAYAPYSNFKVGAALLTSDGCVFTGCNVENSSYGATNCAERTAIFKAVSEGCTSFKKIAIVSCKGDYTYPCGVCLQVMGEFADPKTFKIILSNNDKDIKEILLQDMLPFAFTKENLN